MTVDRPQSRGTAHKPVWLGTIMGWRKGITLWTCPKCNTVNGRNRI